MDTFIGPSTFWQWFILCTVFMVFEVLLPGFVFMWMGIAAGVTGFLVLFLPSLSWQVQAIVFAVLSVASIALGRVYQRRNPTVTDHPALNRRGEQYIGRRFTLDEPIVNGHGKLRVDDTSWRVTGADLPAGTPVKVTGVSGASLVVEKA
ncbi:MAG: NfeD family protein [Alphaproteobacteria bacterium]